MDIQKIVQLFQESNFSRIDDGFHLEQADAEFDHYVGNVGNILWKLRVYHKYHEASLEQAKRYVDILYEHIDMLEERCNQEPKILYEYGPMKAVYHRSDEDEVVGEAYECEHGTYMKISINNGFAVTLHMDGTIDISDTRDYILHSGNFTWSN